MKTLFFYQAIGLLCYLTVANAATLKQSKNQKTPTVAKDEQQATSIESPLKSRERDDASSTASPVEPTAPSSARAMSSSNDDLLNLGNDAEPIDLGAFADPTDPLAESENPISPRVQNADADFNLPCHKKHRHPSGFNNFPGKDFRPIEELPIKEFPIKGFPIKEIPIKEFPIKEFPIKEFPIKEVAIKELPDDTIIDESLTFGPNPGKGPCHKHKKFRPTPLGPPRVEPLQPISPLEPIEPSVPVGRPFPHRPCDKKRGRHSFDAEQVLPDDDDETKGLCKQINDNLKADANQLLNTLELIAERIQHRRNQLELIRYRDMLKKSTGSLRAMKTAQFQENNRLVSRASDLVSQNVGQLAKQLSSKKLFSDLIRFIQNVRLLNKNCLNPDDN